MGGGTLDWYLQSPPARGRLQRISNQADARSSIPARARRTVPLVMAVGDVLSLQSPLAQGHWYGYSTKSILALQSPLARGGPRLAAVRIQEAASIPVLTGPRDPQATGRSIGFFKPQRTGTTSTLSTELGTVVPFVFGGTQGPQCSSCSAIFDPRIGAGAANARWFGRPMISLNPQKLGRDAVLIEHELRLRMQLTQRPSRTADARVLKR